MVTDLTIYVYHGVLFHVSAFTPKYGARQVSGIVRNYLRRPVFRMILSGELGNGDLLKGDLDAEQNLKWEVVHK